MESGQPTLILTAKRGFAVNVVLNDPESMSGPDHHEAG
jgi:hypothetical protein